MAVMKTVGYLRLSKDDGENKLSESIENQKKLITEYVKHSDDLELVRFYLDDGYTGLTFNRPGFQELIQDMKDGKIQCIITKDFSRLGRDHVETSSYIERVFPQYRVRYISVLDNYDSLLKRNEELMPFKTVFNDMYSRDISKKVKGVLDTKKKSGLFMSNFAPYGYVKDPKDKHRFLIDPQAAEVVKRIFKLYLSGYSRDRIAKKLNEEGVLTPSEYKRQVLGFNYTNALEKDNGKGWGYATIYKILSNEMYTGAMVQHRSEKISYKIEKFRNIPKEEQIVVEGTHEAIISKSVFLQVQELAKKRTRTPGFVSENKKVNPYAGIIVCGDCGYNFQRVTCRDGYDCGAYHKKGTAVCFSHFIKKEILDQAVLGEIRRQASLAFMEKDKDEILKASEQRREAEKHRREKADQIEFLSEKLTKVHGYKKKLFENFADGVLTKEEYMSYKASYEEQERDLKEKLEEMSKEKDDSQKMKKDYETWIEKFIQYGSLTEVTREIVVELIDKITIDKDNYIDISFKYQSPYGM